MPNDPSTKDLIAAARKAGHTFKVSRHPDTCDLCLFDALADRLEEVEEERAQTAAAFRDFCRGFVHVKHTDETLDPDSPEPSDPEPTPERQGCDRCVPGQAQIDNLERRIEALEEALRDALFCVENRFASQAFLNRARTLLSQLENK